MKIRRDLISLTLIVMVAVGIFVAGVAYDRVLMKNERAKMQDLRVIAQLAVRGRSLLADAARAGCRIAGFGEAVSAVEEIVATMAAGGWSLDRLEEARKALQAMSADVQCEQDTAL